MKQCRKRVLENTFYFFVASILFSWPVIFFVDAWYSPKLLEQGNSIKAMYYLFGGHTLAMFGPALAGIVVFRRLLGKKVPAWNWGKFKHYFKFSVFMLLVWLLPAIWGFLVNSFEIRTNIKSFQVTYIFIYVIVVPFASIAEEAGWCGFLLSYLTPAYGKTRSIIISGIYRGIWHFPILISPLLYKVIAGERDFILLIPLSMLYIIQLIISNVLFGALFGYLWFKFNSLPLLGWIHFLFDLGRDFSVFFIIGYGESILGKFGWALIFYGIAYYCMDRIMREEGVGNFFTFVFSKNFFDINDDFINNNRAL